MYRLQFPSDGSVTGGWHSFSEAWDECLKYGPEKCQIQVYCPDFGIWVATQTQPTKEIAHA